MKINILQQGFANTAIPLILGSTTLAINNFVEQQGIALLFNIVLLLGSVVLFKRVIQSGAFKSWLSIWLGALSIGMPWFAIANIFAIIAPSIEYPLLKMVGYAFVTVVIIVNFFSLIVSVRLESNSLNRKEERLYENTKKNIESAHSVDYINTNG